MQKKGKKREFFGQMCQCAYEFHSEQVDGHQQLNRVLQIQGANITEIEGLGILGAYLATAAVGLIEERCGGDLDGRWRLPARLTYQRRLAEHDLVDQLLGGGWRHGDLQAAGGYRATAGSSQSPLPLDERRLFGRHETEK